LISLTNKWKVKSTDAFLTKLDKWAEQQVAKLTAKGQNMAVQALADRIETLKVLAEGCPTTNDIRTKINSIFQDTENGESKKRITLSTIHKSKGREWDTVYWYGAGKFQPSPYARKEWEQQQEENLMYVAATRAKKNLIQVA
jgi:superfamily I DNA/RNA helicase